METNTQVTLIEELNNKVRELEVKNERYQSEIMELEEALEQAIVDKESQSAKAEKLKSLLNDTVDQMELQILEKDLEIENLKSVMIQNNFMKKRIKEMEDHEARLENNVKEYKEALDALSNWHIEKQGELLTKTAETDNLRLSLDSYQNQFQEIQGTKDEALETIELYKQLLSSSDSLIEEQKQIEKSITKKLNSVYSQIRSYEVALESIISENIQKESDIRQELERLRRENSSLTNLVKSKNRPKIKNNASSDLLTSATNNLDQKPLLISFLVQENSLLDYQTMITTQFITNRFIKSYNTIFGCLFKLLKYHDKCLTFYESLSQLYISNYIDLALHGKGGDDPNKLFLRWIVSLSSILADSVVNVSRIFNHVSKADSQFFFTIMEENSELDKFFTLGLESISKFIDATDMDQLSPSMPLNPLQNFNSKLKIILNSLEPEGRTSYFVFEIFYKLHISVQYLLIGVFNATLFPEISQYLSCSSWKAYLFNLIDSLKNIKPQRKLIELFIRDRPFNFTEITDIDFTLFKNVEKFEALLLTTDESQLEYINEVIPPALESIRSGSDWIKNKSSEISFTEFEGIQTQFPWQSIIQDITYQIKHEGDVYSQIEETNILLGEEKAKYQQLNEEFKRASDEMNNWKSKYSQERIKSTKLENIQITNSTLKAEKQHFMDTMDKYKNEIEILNQLKIKKTKENIDLQQHLIETRKQLEHRKSASVQNTQNEYYKQEATSIKNLFKKIEHEYCEIQAKLMDKDLRSIELGYSTPLSCSTPSFKKQDDFKKNSEASINKLDAKHSEPSIVQAQKLIGLYKNIQQEVLLYSCDVPIWDPSISPGENRERMEDYSRKHDNLSKNISFAEKEIDQYINQLTFCGSLSKTFGEHGSASSFRYLKRFLEIPKNTGNEELLFPSAKLTILKGNNNKPCKKRLERIVVTDDQMAYINRRIMGN